MIGPIESACIAAARDVARLHRLHGLSIVIWRDRQTTEITPDEFDALLDQREASLKDAHAE